VACSCEGRNEATAAVVKTILSLYLALEAHRVMRRRGPHFLDNRLADGGDVVSLTSWPRFIPERCYGTHFC
jgi:hypothetical protein